MAAAKDGKRESEVPEALAGITKLPADDPEVANAVCRDLVAGGTERIEQLIGIVGEFGANEGVKPRYALHALATYCSREGAGEERKLFASTLARQLDAQPSKDVRAFLIRQLQLAGTPAEVPALAKNLHHVHLGLPAVQALTAIGDETAAAALRAALPAPMGRQRAAIVIALGRLRDKPSTAALLAAAKEKDRDIRLAAIHSLAEIGAPEAIETLQGAVAVESPYERTQATEACLLLAQRLKEDGEVEKAKAVCLFLRDTCTEDHEKHVRRAAEKALAAM
jgi:HEAT repeat protein